MGIIPIVDGAPLYLGQKKGFFSKRGLKLSMTRAQGGAAIVPGVTSGQFQCGFSNMTSLVIAQSNGGLVVKKGSSITSAKQLKGKKVAVNTLKNINETAVRESVRKAGGDTSPWPCTSP